MSGSTPVADVRTFADGSTEILNESAPVGGPGGPGGPPVTAPPAPLPSAPVPPSVLLMGSGLMCLLIIHRKIITDGSLREIRHRI
jgi:hypothetical protein